MNPENIAYKSFEFAEEIFNAFKSNSPRRRDNNDDVLIKWIFPPTGRIKMNRDGSSVDHGWASFGGLAREDRGRWLDDSVASIGYALLLKAELWSIRRGLKLVKDRDWKSHFGLGAVRPQ